MVAGKNEQITNGAERLAEELEVAGKRVLIDDRRGVSVGVKFNDAELIGIPTIVIVGKALADGEIEVKDRKTGERSRVAIGEAIPALTTSD